jgi:hypothetical protein
MLPHCRISTALLIPLLFAAPSPARAQADSQGQETSIFQQLFPKPSGQNGYEEIIRAGELAKSSKLLMDAFDPKATLTLKRQVLAEPALKQALALFRVGLEKSLRSPRETGKDPEFQAFGVYRMVARLLAVEQYVLLADGRVSQAIDSVRDGLRLGYAVQSDLLIGGLVGVAIDSTVMSSLTQHVEQFSVSDCKKVMTLARAWLNAPDPAIAAITSERQMMLSKLKENLALSKGALPEEQILALVNSRIDFAIENLKHSLWERKAPPTIEGNPMVAAYVNALGIDAVLTSTSKSFAKDQARMQVLGVHAAIRAYRWENNRLPDSLEELKLGKLAIDPFTGKTLAYKRTGETTYELTSDGLKPVPNTGS